MGCDIHVYAEVRTGGGYGFDIQLFPVRSYRLFALLAGVRNTNAVVPISAPRGIPADVSVGVMDAYRELGNDAHTPSWLTLPELLKNVARFAEIDHDLKIWRCWVYTLIAMADATYVAEDAARIVFWFDN